MQVSVERVERIKVLRDFYEPRELALEYIHELEARGWQIVEETTDGHPPEVPAYRTILERRIPGGL
jgi:hypothetical protein